MKKELEEIYNKAEELVKEYNIKAKELKSFSRLGLISNNHDYRLEDEGIELPEDWEPECWEDIVSNSFINAPEGEGWFPSDIC